MISLDERHTHSRINNNELNTYLFILLLLLSLKHLVYFRQARYVYVALSTLLLQKLGLLVTGCNGCHTAPPLEELVLSLGELLLLISELKWKISLLFLKDSFGVMMA